MSDVLFEEEKSYTTPSQHVGNTSAFATYVKKFGFAKTDKDAEVVLLSVAAIALATGVIVAWVAFGGSSETVELPPVPSGVQVRPPAL